MLCRLGQEGSGWHSHALSYSTRCWVPGGAYNGQNRQPQGLHGTSGRGCTHGLQLVPLVSRPPTLPVPRAPGRCAAPNLRNAERDTRGGISEATPPLAHTRPPTAPAVPLPGSPGSEERWMRGGMWKRVSPGGPARRGLGARPRRTSPATCRDSSGVCKVRQSWSQGGERPPCWVCTLHTFTLSLVGAPCGSSAAAEGHFFTSCP